MHGNLPFANINKQAAFSPTARLPSPLMLSFTKRVSSERQSTQCALLSVIFASSSSILLLAVYMYRYGLEKARLFATPSPRQASARAPCIRINSPPLVCNLAALINMTLKRGMQICITPGPPPTSTRLYARLRLPSATEARFDSGILTAQLFDISCFHARGSMHVIQFSGRALVGSPSILLAFALVLPCSCAARAHGAGPVRRTGGCLTDEYCTAGGGVGFHQPHLFPSRIGCYSRHRVLTQPRGCFLFADG